MHEQIKNFSLEGEMGQEHVGEVKKRLVEHLEGQMRDQGFVPSIDNEVQFTRTFNPSSETYQFALTVYGVYVGRNLAWHISGMTNGKMVKKVTQPSR